MATVWRNERVVEPKMGRHCHAALSSFVWVMGRFAGYGRCQKEYMMAGEWRIKRLSLITV